MPSPTVQSATARLPRAPGGRSNPHERRANPNATARRIEGRLPAFALLGLALGALGCDRPAKAGSAPTCDDELKELVEVLSPLGKTVTSDITDKRFLRGRELLGILRASGPACGDKALAILRAKPEGGTTRPVDVERALLDVAAHAAPDETLQLLETLVNDYGPSLDLRTTAALLLAEIHPKRAVEVL